jgi:hypothetical protein
MPTSIGTGTCAFLYDFFLNFVFIACVVLLCRDNENGCVGDEIFNFHFCEYIIVIVYLHQCHLSTKHDDARGLYFRVFFFYCESAGLGRFAEI